MDPGVGSSHGVNSFGVSPCGLRSAREGQALRAKACPDLVAGPAVHRQPRVFVADVPQALSPRRARRPPSARDLREVTGGLGRRPDTWMPSRGWRRTRSFEDSYRGEPRLVSREIAWGHGRGIDDADLREPGPSHWNRDRPIVVPDGRSSARGISNAFSTRRLTSPPGLPRNAVAGDGRLVPRAGTVLREDPAHRRRKNARSASSRSACPEPVPVSASAMPPGCEQWLPTGPDSGGPR